MIAPPSGSPSKHTAKTLPVAMEFAVRCPRDVELAVESIITAMGQFPFSVSDGFAVQQAVSQALTLSIDQLSQIRLDHHLRVRIQITSQFVRVQIEDIRGDHDEETIPAVFSRFTNPQEQGSPAMQMLQTYLTTIEVQNQGRQAVLYRAKGHGAAISAPPLGYDFQI